MRGISSLKFLAGFCYTQLTDIEQEVNGLLTYDRKPQIDPERITGFIENPLRDLNLGVNTTQSRDEVGTTAS